MSDAPAVSASHVTRALGFVRQRLQGRPDSEHEQAIVRIVIVALASAYFLVLDWVHNFSDPHFVWGTLLTAGYLLLSTVYLGLIVAEPGISPVRRLIAMVTDMAMIFVPSAAGISHSPHELTRWEDCANGANVLLQTVLRVDAE